MEDSNRNTDSPTASTSTFASRMISSPTISTPPTTSGRKRESTQDRYGGLPGPKRQRLMGRPRNGWTRSRRRKLVRLYLMTDLEIDDLAAAIRSHRFKPCKRDIQKQLNSLLQARPNQVRSKGDMTKKRLQILRECKTLRSRKRYTEKSHPQPSEAQVTSEVHSHLLSPEKTSELPYLVPAEVTAATKLPPNVRYPASSRLTQVTKDNTRGNAAPNISTKTKDDERPLLKDALDLAKAEPIHDTCSDQDVKASESDVNGKDDASIISTSAKSTRSLISLTSLKRRLQFRYSASDLDDIKSLLGRLTISRSSEVSTPSSSQSLEMKSRLPGPTQFDHPVILPGVFPQYCWEHICHNELARCDDIRLPCNRGPIYQPLGLETHRSIHPNVLFRIQTCKVRGDDLESVDTFGNSVLHIAACLGAPLSYLTSMVTMGVKVNKLNNADQTFLHLISLSDTSALRDFPTLLGALAKRRFDFQQQDHNGQTALHLLTQYSPPWKVLSGLLQCFQFHGIDLPSSRDNRGYTVAEQLRQHGFKLGWPYDQDRPLKIPESTSQNQGHLRATSWPTTIDNNKTDFVSATDPEYEKHASLLRTIVQSSTHPTFTDSEGRNGLHCLAEVRLDLPLPLPNPIPSSRENTMKQLILAGVSPNSFSKVGSTPLMAFIASSQAESPELLTLLLSSNANPNLRNAQGETALHISVKLGLREATKLLLAHGANVHARTSRGEGIVALGMRYANKGRARHDEVLYAQINLCVFEVAERGGVSQPTVLDEWGSKEFRVLSDGEVEVAVQRRRGLHSPTLFYQNSQQVYNPK